MDDITDSQKDVSRKTASRLLFEASEEEQDPDLEPAVHQTVQTSEENASLSSGHLLSQSSPVCEEENGGYSPSPSSTGAKNGPFGQQANEEEVEEEEEEEEESRSFHNARANLLDLTDGTTTDTTRAELSICDDSPGAWRHPATRTVPEQLQAHGLGLLGDERRPECSSISFPSSHEQRKPRHSVSFAQTSKAASSRPPSAETEAGVGSSSSFQCRDGYPRVSFLQGEDGMTFDASHGELLPGSRSPSLVLSASSDSDVRPKVIIFDFGTSPRRTQHESIKTVMFRPIPKLSALFSFWKTRYRQQHSFSILAEPDVIPQFRPAVSQIAGRAYRLKELAERYELLSEIDAQHELNAKLKERLQQMERERISTQRSVAVSNRFERNGNSSSYMTDIISERPYLSAHLLQGFI
jgi:hypothetical protein